MKEKIKAIIAFSVVAIITIIFIILDIKDKARSTDVFPTDETKIMLYGEAHGSKIYYDIEFDLWKDCYDKVMRDLFVEHAYFNAKYMNLWMSEDTDEKLDEFMEDISDTQTGNRYFREFLERIKTECPETVFHGTDIGHQLYSTAPRYLAYLEEHGMKDSEEYKETLENMAQAEEHMALPDQNYGMNPLREGYMVDNFIEAYDSVGGKIMGIYGSYHTDLSNPELMAGRLKAHYGDIISSVTMSTLARGQLKPYRFGLSVTGIIFLLMLFVPNICWAKWGKPVNYENFVQKENRILLILERVGEVLVTCFLLIFPATGSRVKLLPEGLYFDWTDFIRLTAFVLMILYECFWIRYFGTKKTMQDYYSSFAGFPVAGATLPVIAVLLLGIHSKNLLLIGAAIILGIGHIGIHLQHKKEASDISLQEQKADLQ